MRCQPGGLASSGRRWALGLSLLCEEAERERTGSGQILLKGDS